MSSVRLDSPYWNVSRIEFESRADHPALLELHVEPADQSSASSLSPGNRAYIGWYDTPFVIEHSEPTRSRVFLVRLRPDLHVEQDPDPGFLVVIQHRPHNRGVDEQTVKDVLSRAACAPVSISEAPAGYLTRRIAPYVTLFTFPGQDPARRIAQLASLFGESCNVPMSFSLPFIGDSWWLEDMATPAFTLDSTWTVVSGSSGWLQGSRRVDPGQASAFYRKLLFGRSHAVGRENVPTGPCAVRYGGALWLVVHVTASFTTENRRKPDGSWSLVATDVLAGGFLRRPADIVPEPAVHASRVLLGRVADHFSTFEDGSRLVAIEPIPPGELPSASPRVGEASSLAALGSWSTDSDHLLALMTSAAFDREDAPGLHVRWQPGDHVLVRVSDAEVPIVLGAPSRHRAHLATPDAPDMAIFGSRATVGDPSSGGARLDLPGEGRLALLGSDLAFGPEEPS